MEKEIIGLFLNECITIDSVGGPASDRGDKVDIGTVIRISKFLCVSLFSETSRGACCAPWPDIQNEYCDGGSKHGMTEEQEDRRRGGETFSAGEAM